MRKRSLIGAAFAALSLGLGSQAVAQMLGNGQYGPLPGTTWNGGYGANSGITGAGSAPAPATTGDTGSGSGLGNFGPGPHGYEPGLGNFGPNTGTKMQPPVY